MQTLTEKLQKMNEEINQEVEQTLNVTNETTNTQVVAYKMRKNNYAQDVSKFLGRSIDEWNSKYYTCDATRRKQTSHSIYQSYYFQDIQYKSFI